MAALLGGEAVNKAARFAASVALARSLTLQEFGLVNVAIALSGILAIVASLGLSDYGARIAATDPGRLPRLVTPVLAARLGTLLVLATVCVGATLLMSPNSVGLVALAAAMSLGVVASLDWLLRGGSRMREVAMATSTGGVVVLMLCLFVVPRSPSVSVALAAFIAAELTVAAITWAAARVRPAALSEADAIRPIVRDAWPLAVTAIVVYAYSANLDTILLSVLRSPEDAGLYSAPYRLFLAGTAVAIFAGYAYLPRLAVAVGSPAEVEVMRSLRRALTAMCGYGVVLTGLTELVGARVLGFLFGAEFEAMDAAFVILVSALPWYTLGFPAGYTLIARGMERRFMLGAGAAGVTNLGLNFALIPPLGPSGAAVATTVALAVGTAVWLREHALLAPLTPAVGLAAFATAGAGAVALVEAAGPFVAFPTVLGGLVLVAGSRPLR